MQISALFAITTTTLYPKVANLIFLHYIIIQHIPSSSTTTPTPRIKTTTAPSCHRRPLIIRRKSVRPLRRRRAISRSRQLPM
ncbi:hypothetical protein HanPSC8_Chr05g0203661 [Helianthus annuus]|nr:hypothetical protein HanPSC8_Chr05g0203661 [Helianthus annuus]